MNGRRTNKTEQFILATSGFFWCFLMWMAPFRRIVAGWSSDKLGAPITFSLILAVTGLFSIASSFADSYSVLFLTRVVVALAGISFVVGIQHVAQWFEDKEIGLAEGLYAGTGNAGGGGGAV